MVSREAMTDFVEGWGLAVAGSAAVLEAALIIQRRLAEKRGWRPWPTISMVFRDDGKQWLIFPFTWGLLAGHWWGPWGRPAPWDYLVWVGTAAAILGRDVHNRWNPTPLPKKWTLAALCAGMAEGAVFWSSGNGAA